MNLTSAPKKKPVRRMKSESPSKKPAPHRGFNTKAREMLLDPSKKVCNCTKHLHDSRCPDANHKKTLISANVAKPPKHASKNEATFANKKAHRMLCDSGKSFSSADLDLAKA
ncbi:hypothetical protein L596_021429 [Steinernema carpocapsae]|nr:hypothetical protein L596_021429 [Steinernema carpocapsae]